MRSIFIILIIFLLFPCITFSQSVSGIVKSENGEAIVFATISLLNSNDSSIIAYTVTDDNGLYKLEVSQAGEYLLKAQSLGYKLKIKKISLFKNERSLQTDFILEDDVFFLNEVQVKSRATGIQYKEDTIRYNPKMYIDGSEIVLGDVLDKLPGVEVKNDGSVTAHGKNVEKVLLDGQDFFSGNTQMAVNNLPADIAENVEVLNNYSEYSLLDGFKSHEKTVINVGVNKEKFGKISGKLSAGGAFKDKYYAKGNIMQINPKSMISFLGSINNTGEQVFSIMDYLSMQGGLNEFFNDVQNNMGISEEEIRLLMSKNNTYSNVNGLSALNIVYNPKSNLKFNTYVIFNKNKTLSEDLSKFIYNLPYGLNNTSEQNSKTISKSDLLSGYFKVNYQPDPTLNIIYNSIYTFSKMNETVSSLNSFGNKNIRNYTTDHFNTFSTQQKAVLMKSINKHLLMANFSFDYENKPSYYDLKTDSLILPLNVISFEDWYYLRQNKTPETFNGQVSLSFLYKINNQYFIKSSINGDINKKIYKTSIQQDIPKGNIEYFENDSLRNDISLLVSDINATINLTKNKGLFRFKIGASAHLYNYGNGISSEINEKTKFKLNPNVELSLYFSDKHYLSLSFSELLSRNPISIFASGMVLDNFQTYSKNHKMEYLNNIRYNVDLTYNIYDMFSNTMFMIYGGYIKTKHSNIYDYYQNGPLTYYYAVLAPLNDNSYIRMNFNKGISFMPWDLGLNASYSNGSYISKIAGIDNKVISDNTGAKIRLTSRYKKIFNVDLFSGVDYVKNNPSLGEVSKQIIQRYGGKLNLNFSKKIYSYIEYEYIINESIERKSDFHNLNASIRYKLNKKLEFELIGMNMLNLKRQEWSTVTYTANYTLEHYFRQIPGYIMLRVNWQF